MIVYVPTLITSAEQAEQLPVGTIAILDDDTLPVALHVTKTAEHLMPWRNGKHVGADENVVGAQALVPIEAEEQMDTYYYTGGDGPPIHRYVTRWETVSDPSPGHSIDGREAHE